MAQYTKKLMDGDRKEKSKSTDKDATTQEEKLQVCA